MEHEDIVDENDMEGGLTLGMADVISEVMTGKNIDMRESAFSGLISLLCALTICVGSGCKGGMAGIG